MFYCNHCGDDVAPNRYRLGYKTCLVCGERKAKQYKHCIVPLAKSNYQPITDLSLLKQLNKYAKT